LEDWYKISYLKYNNRFKLLISFNFQSEKDFKKLIKNLTKLIFLVVKKEN
jgi:hypothetical protein